ncbi:MAG: hypothetical protein FWG90_11100 [Oscillospiraceae bacterium]|nr:hypothetical protein [Oscillospiraceae bacterium]
MKNTIKIFLALVISITICPLVFNANVGAASTDIEFGWIDSNTSLPYPEYYTYDGSWEEGDVSTFKVYTSDVDETAIKIGGLRQGDIIKVKITNTLGDYNETFF